MFKVKSIRELNLVLTFFKIYYVCNLKYHLSLNLKLLTPVIFKKIHNCQYKKLKIISFNKEFKQNNTA